MSNLAIVTDGYNDKDRRIKVTQEQVYGYLSDNEWHTMADMAAEFDCTSDTVRRRVKTLLENSHFIIKGPKGIRLADGVELDTETIDEILAMLKWVFAGVGSMSRHAVPAKKVFPKIRAALPKTKPERYFLRSMMVKITHLIDWDSIDDMDVPG